MNLSIGNVITLNVIIIMGLFFSNCENIITDNSKVGPAYGCTDYNACNYDGNANVNDGSWIPLCNMEYR